MNNYIIDLEYDSENILLLEYLAKLDTSSLLGICSSYGKSSEVENRYSIKKILDKLGIQARLYEGECRPMMGEYEYIDGISHCQRLDKGVSGKSVGAYKEMFDKANEKIDILIAGPVTNLAYFLKIYPEYGDKIAKVILASGSFAYGTATPCSEHRVYFDAPSYDYILGIGLEVYMIALDVVREDCFPIESIVLVEEYNAYKGESREFTVLPKNSVRSVLGLYYIMDTKGFCFNKYKCVVETGSKEAYAMTVVYTNDFDGIFKQTNGEYVWTVVSDCQRNINYLSSYEYEKIFENIRRCRDE